MWEGTLTTGWDNDAQAELDLTPSPRLLEVLGDIPYQPWQCLAELVDNAFDEFDADPDRDPSEPPVIHITLPKASTVLPDAQVSVSDNGRGMSRATLQNALRAGFSGNSRYGSLGLFGMGFNIATARLGNKTEVRTTQAGDMFWLVTEIDFRELQRRESFHVPLRRERKDDPRAHGTVISVRELKPNMFESLRRSATVSKVRERLGDIYSYLLRSHSPIDEVSDDGTLGSAVAGQTCTTSKDFAPSDATLYPLDISDLKLSGRGCAQVVFVISRGLKIFSPM